MYAGIDRSDQEMYLPQKGDLKLPLKSKERIIWEDKEREKRLTSIRVSPDCKQFKKVGEEEEGGRKSCGWPIFMSYA